LPHQLLLDIFVERLSDRHHPIVRFRASARKNEFPRHENVLVMTLAEQHFRRRTGAVDQDQRGGVFRTDIRMLLLALLIRHELGEIVHGMVLAAGRNSKSSAFLSKPCMRCAHCQPTIAPLIGCINPKDKPSVSGSQSARWIQ
jgi:hypothetical protein